MKYFIYDCHGHIVGNPKGYATFRGASRIESGRNSEVRALLWDRFTEKRRQELAAGIPKENCSRGISSIKLGDASARDVIRALYGRMRPDARQHAHRDARHSIIREMLGHHAQAQDLHWRTSR